MTRSTDPAAVPCPRCGSPADEPCRRVQGAALYVALPEGAAYHLARWDAADAAAKAPK